MVGRNRKVAAESSTGGKRAPKKNRYLARIEGEGGAFSTFEIMAPTYAGASRAARRLAGSKHFTLKRIQSPGILATIVYFLGRAFGEARR